MFTQNCALSGCHVGPNALLNLDLSEGNAYANLVGVPSIEVASLQLVAENQPDRSYLIMKLEGSEEIAAGSMLMPIGRASLKEDDTDGFTETRQMILMK